MQSDASAPSLYEQLGQRAGITAVVNRLYDLIAQDSSVTYYFNDTGMPRQGLTDFLVAATGGPVDPAYQVPDLAKVHHRFNISDEAFGVVGKYLGQAMQENGVSPETMATVTSVVLGLHDQIVPPAA